MNYHLMIDEKFTDDFIADAERYAPGNNCYLVTLYTPEPRFTKSPLIIYCRSVRRYWFSHVLPHLEESDRVFIHWLDRRLYDIVLSLPAVINVGIFSWMGDLIATPLCLFEREILKPVSYAFFKKHQRYRFQKAGSHGTLYNLLLFGRHLFRLATARAEWKKKRRVMQRINLFFHWNEFDYQWVRRHYPGFDARLVYFVYDVGLESALPVPRSAKGKDEPLTIWLGNSATVTNNHFEALDLLAHLSEEHIEIICPLSYGESTGSLYTRKVIEKGQRIFGDRFIPLLAYVDRDRYYGMFQKVDLVLMNHIRSQAAGNVFAFLKLGKPVFMEERSPLFQFLCAKDCRMLHRANDLMRYSFAELKALSSGKGLTVHPVEIVDLGLKAENLRRYLE